MFPRPKAILAEGGKLYALRALVVPSSDTRNWKSQKVKIGEEFGLDWIEMDEVHSPKDDLHFRSFRQGAACFLEVKECVILWVAFISREPTEENLFSEPNDSDLVDNCDNISVAPLDDLVLCKDGGDRQFFYIITPK